MNIGTGASVALCCRAISDHDFGTKKVKSSNKHQNGPSFLNTDQFILSLASTKQTYTVKCNTFRTYCGV